MHEKDTCALLYHTTLKRRYLRRIDTKGQALDSRKNATICGKWSVVSCDDHSDLVFGGVDFFKISKHWRERHFQIPSRMSSAHVADEGLPRMRRRRPEALDRRSLILVAFLRFWELCRGGEKKIAWRLSLVRLNLIVNQGITDGIVGFPRMVRGDRSLLLQTFKSFSMALDFPEW